MTPALLGAATLWLAMHWGIGLSNDSGIYVQAANHLIEGEGLRTTFSTGEPRPLTHFPPMYPAMLAVGALVSGDPIVGAKWLHAILFAANIALVAWMLHTWDPSSRLRPFVGGFLMLTSIDMLSVHSTAFSEPLFFFAGFCGVYMLARYLETQRIPWLVAAAAMTLLALLTRYAGASFVPAAILGLVLWGRRPIRYKLRDVVVFLLVTAGPVVLWLGRNAVVAGHLSNRGLTGALVNREAGFHDLPLKQMLQGISTMSQWILPEAVPLPLRISALLLVGGLWALSTSPVRWRSHSCARPRARLRLPYWERGRPLPFLLSSFIFVYVSVLLLAASFLDLSFIGSRVLSPVFIALLLLLLTSSKICNLQRKPFKGRSLVAVLLACFLASYLVRGAAFVSFLYQNGSGFTAMEWRESELMRKIKSLPPSAWIYTNAPGATFLLTGRTVLGLPPARLRFGDAPNPDYEARMRELRRKIGTGRVALALFDRKVHSDPRLGPVRSAPTMAELAEDLPLDLIYRAEDGSLYKWRGSHGVLRQRRAAGDRAALP